MRPNQKQSVQDDGTHLLPRKDKAASDSNGKHPIDDTTLLQEISLADLENKEDDLIQHYVVSDDEKEEEVATTHMPKQLHKLNKASRPKPRSQKTSQSEGAKSDANPKKSKSMPRHVPVKSPGVAKKEKRKTTARNKHGR